MSKIDRIKLRLRGFSTELDKDIDETKRLLITTEVDFKDVHYPKTGDENYSDKVYDVASCGSTIVQEYGNKALVATGKSKRSQSKKLRQALWSINPSEDYYEVITNKIIVNLESVIEFLKDK